MNVCRHEWQRIIRVSFGEVVDTVPHAFGHLTDDEGTVVGSLGRRSAGGGLVSMRYSCNSNGLCRSC